MIVAMRRAGAWKAALAALAAGTACVPPALAQTTAEARLKRVEAEVRALQRRVFPDGAGRFFEAEIRPPDVASAAPPPSSSAITDLLARVESIEGQLARFTAALEENTNRSAKLEARLAALESAGVPVQGPQAGGRAGLPQASNGGLAAEAATPAVTGVAGVTGAIERPQTTDAGEDAYLYGYRLWEAKLYSQAAQQLQATVEKYPRHQRISYARNLLGRAYLDDGKPGAAAQVFLENYQADRKGARAPDSLLYLATAMIRLKENGRACVALQELSEVYPKEVAGRLSADYASARSAGKCN